MTADASRAGDAGGWGALDLEIPAELEDDLVACLGQESLGAEVVPVGRRVRLTVYLPSTGAACVAAARAAQRLKESKLDPVACGLRVRCVEDDRWVERYQERLEPFALGARFRVYPAGVVADDPEERIPIVLVPGRAFGTGEHPTTQLCVRQLERLVGEGERWVDVGCGSAILSIVAHHCGAARVLALDADPEAVEVAAQVLRSNALGDRIELAQGSVREAGGSPWDGVVANIAAPFFCRSATNLADLLVPGGLLIASGLAEQEIGEAREAITRSGLSEIDDESQAGWWALAFRRPPGGRH